MDLQSAREYITKLAKLLRSPGVLAVFAVALVGARGAEAESAPKMGRRRKNTAPR